VYHKLEKAIGVCWELKNNKKGRNFNKEVLPFDFLGSHFTLFESWQIIVKSHKNSLAGCYAPCTILK